MKIEFENGNKITTIDDTEEAARSKRYAEFITYNRKHPYNFMKRMGYLNNLYWYQRIWIWVIYQLSKLKRK